jgi:small GTP-binding protein
MADYNTQIKDIEAEIAKTKYNKATQHHIGLLKAKIAKLKEKEASRGGGGGGEGFTVRRTGDGTVILLGFPSAGKSTLLNTITNAQSEVGAYAFTTLTCIPGLLEYKHAQIQVLDVPGIVAGAASGRGRGKEVLAAMRSADMAIVLLDALRINELPIILKEAREAHIRLNERQPDVKIVRTAKGGVDIGRTVATPELDDETIKGICNEFRLHNSQIVIRTPINADQFIDAIEANKKYMPMLLVVNKADLLTPEERTYIEEEIKPDLFISAALKQGTEELKERIYQRLDFIRIYMKEPGKPADMDVPMIMQRNDTIRRVCEKLHKDFVKNFKFARVTGPSSKFPGQKLMLNHVLKDQDIVELHIR